MLTRGVPTAHGAPTHDPSPQKWPPENPGPPQGPSVPGMPSHQTWNERLGFPLAWSGLGGIHLSTAPFSRRLSAHRRPSCICKEVGSQWHFMWDGPPPPSAVTTSRVPHPFWLPPAVWFLPASPRSCWACAHVLLGSMSRPTIGLTVHPLWAITGGRGPGSKHLCREGALYPRNLPCQMGSEGSLGLWSWKSPSS